MTRILYDDIPLEHEGTPVSSVMRKDVVSLPEDARLGEAIALFVEQGIGGIPLVDKSDRVVAFLSDGDLMGAVAQHRAHSIYTGGDASLLYFDNEGFDERINGIKERLAMDFATRKVLCAHPEQNIARVAALLSRKKLKRLPVVDRDGVLIGMVQRSDIMRYIFKKVFS